MPNYKLDLPEDQINIILRALGDQPYVAVHAVIAEIQKQCDNPAETVEAEKPETTD
jgi:hypothetical protein